MRPGDTLSVLLVMRRSSVRFRPAAPPKPPGQRPFSELGCGHSRQISFGALRTTFGSAPDPMRTEDLAPGCQARRRRGSAPSLSECRCGQEFSGPADAGRCAGRAGLGQQLVQPHLPQPARPVCHSVDSDRQRELAHQRDVAGAVGARHPQCDGHAANRSYDEGRARDPLSDRRSTAGESRRCLSEIQLLRAQDSPARWWVCVRVPVAEDDLDRAE
jgi:hypothetical protein